MRLHRPHSWTSSSLPRTLSSYFRVLAASPPTFYFVRLMDKGVLVDDELATQRPDAEGRVELGVHLTEMDSPDLPLEIEPDPYLILSCGDETVHTTPDMPEDDVLSAKPHSGSATS